MNKQQKSFSWLRLLLWSHVFGVIAFYLILWFRSNPRSEKSLQAPSDPSPARPPRPDVLRPTGTASARPPVPPIQTVSIIVPARNEQRNIQRCVTSLLEQDYGSYEVIVVDDGSTDDTPCILDDIAHHHPHGDKLWVLRLKDLPSDWAGKPHALHAGVQEAHGNWLLFTDADTWHAPNALSTALARATSEQIDLYTLGTKQELPGFWNKVMMPVAYLGISMQYPIYKVNDPTSAIAIANGQFILLRRAVYDITGGYARPDLRNTLLDDRDLAHVVKQNGFRLRMEDGQNLVHVYMYSNLRDTWRGWRKNAYLGSRGGVPFVLLELLGLPMIAIVPFLLPLFAWLSWRTRSNKIARSSDHSLPRRGSSGHTERNTGQIKGIAIGGRTPAMGPAPHPHRPRPYDIRTRAASEHSRDGGWDDVGLGPLRASALFHHTERTRTRPVTPQELALAGALELGSVLSYRLWLDRNLAVPWYYAFTYPLAAALFTGILAESAWRVLTHKGVDWSGRTYYEK
ncbi:MAG: glycosyltransferase [Ktedonobacteraceae bacterium]